MRNGEHFSESPVLMVEKLLMAISNFILLKAVSSSFLKVMLALLGKHISTIKLTNQMSSALLKEKPTRRIQLSILLRFLPLHKVSKNSKNPQL
jgi:hypothetical protein